MNFELHERRPGGRRTAATPLATLLKGRNIGLNAFAVNKYGLTGTHIELLFDSESGVIGLRPLAEPTANSYPVRRYKSAHYISAGSFFDAYNIPGDRKPRQLSEAEIDGRLVLTMKVNS